jgi:hypothetical protein
MSAPDPMAVFVPPVELLKRGNAPLAVFLVPDVLFERVPYPLALFSVPVMVKLPAFVPRRVLLAAKDKTGGVWGQFEVAPDFRLASITRIAGNFV